MAKPIGTDLKILQLLSEGFTQAQVAQELNKLGYIPCSLSSVEKKLVVLKHDYKAQTVMQLMYKVGLRRHLK